MATKLISREEAQNQRLLPFGKKHGIRLLIENLQPGELVEIDKIDFNWKRKTPNLFCLELEKSSSKKFKTYKKTDGKGWVVERVE